MGNFISTTTVEEIEPTEATKKQRHLLMQQIKQSKVKLKKS